MRRRSAIATVTAFVLASWLVQSTADASPSASAPDTARHGQIGTTSIADVTLLTGHTVRVSRSPDGRRSVIVIDTPPGADGSVLTFTDPAGDLHVVPREAQPFVQRGLLDPRLFNVTDLVADGYADDDRSGLPVMLAYPERVGAARVRDQAVQLRTAGTAAVRAFETAGAVAATVRKSEAADFWDAVTDPPTARTSTPDLLGPTAKIWLDGTVETTLDESVPLVGAPEAWAEGYDGTGVTVAVLDTGYDPTHPDLAGRVVGTEDFDGTDSVVDGNGHGTHVAATVAGSGSASGGSRKGVAPGADLLIGKVLANNGQGQESWVLAGMEWAAAQDADVVNLSLGSTPTDGTDPLSQAVDALTESTGTLFVIAAGNAGPSPGSVSAPGAADAALTVGNTDKTDLINRGSSRGPRRGDHAVKPEISAPGTNIVAARAAGTSLGSPVDQYYTSLTGTSMATPHVSGAAAILVQRHPEWSPARIKAALVGYAEAPASGTVFEYGSGRLDIPAALDATVVAEQSTVSFGFQPWPNADLEPMQRTVAYRNIGDAPVTLDLSVTGTHSAGTPVPSGAVSVSPTTLVVAAGQTASAKLTVVPAQIEAGDVSGVVPASVGDGDAIRTPWSYGEENERYTLTVDAIGRDGQRSTGWAMVWSESMGRSFWNLWLDGSGPQTVRLPKGDYMVLGGSTVYDDAGKLAEETIAGSPDVSLGSDRTVLLDAREGNRLAFKTPRPATPQQLQLGWTRWYEGGGSMDGWLQYSGEIPRLAVAPSAAVDDGKFEFVAGGRLVAPGEPPGQTPYLYDLLLPTPDRLPSSGTYRVAAHDLARVDTTFVGVGEDGRTTHEKRLGFSALGATSVGGTSPVEVAGPRADFVSANGTIWQSMVALPQSGDLKAPTMWDNYQTFAPGARLRTRWWGAPYSVGTDSDYSVTDAYRRANRLSILVRDYQDGEPDHWG